MRTEGGTKDACFRLSNTRRGNTAWHEPDWTLRIDYVGQNGTTCVKLSFIETRLQVSTVQVLKAITSERRSFLELHSYSH